jgi:hypothetical protein
VSVRAWAIEPATNPNVVRVHVTEELTDRTIVTSPPAEVAMPIAGLLEIEAVRTIDLHRYRIRMNLRPGSDRVRTAAHARDVLLAGWGEPVRLEPDEGPRAFEVANRSRRTVAESAEMAHGHALLEAVFRVDGVSEAIAGDGVLLVRLGRLFDWERQQDAVSAALRGVARQTSSDVGGTPGSTSSPS